MRGGVPEKNWDECITAKVLDVASHAPAMGSGSPAALNAVGRHCPDLSAPKKCRRGHWIGPVAHAHLDDRRRSLRSGRHARIAARELMRREVGLVGRIERSGLCWKAIDQNIASSLGGRRNHRARRRRDVPGNRFQSVAESPEPRRASRYGPSPSHTHGKGPRPAGAAPMVLSMVAFQSVMTSAPAGAAAPRETDKRTPMSRCAVVMACTPSYRRGCRLWW